MATGVYIIRNSVNGKLYVGSAAKCFRTRWNLHLWQLRLGKHHSTRLQRSWDKHGEAVFEFRVCEVTSPEHAVAVEQVMIDYYKSANPQFGYNVSPTAGSQLGVKRTPLAIENLRCAARIRMSDPIRRARQSCVAKKQMENPEHRERVRLAAVNHYKIESNRKAMSEMATKRMANHEAREAISEAMKTRMSNPKEREKLSVAATAQMKTPGAREHLSKLATQRMADPANRAAISAANKGRVHSGEAKAKMSASRKGRRMSGETKAKISAANSGRKHTEESKMQMSQTKRLKFAARKANESDVVSMCHEVNGVDLPTAEAS